MTAATIKNLTNSPYDLMSTKGFVRLPAFGEVSAEFSEEYLQLLKAGMAADVVDGEPDIEVLREEYRARFDKAADKRWSVARLTKELESDAAGN